MPGKEVPGTLLVGAEEGDRRNAAAADAGEGAGIEGRGKRAVGIDSPPPIGTYQKDNMFSRISFPNNSSIDGGGGEGAGKKRKSSELALKSGLKDHHEPSHHRSSSDGHREEWKGSKGGASSSVESWRGGSGRYDHESSKEYHFKRKPFSSSSRREAEEEGRPARGSRKREAHEHGSKRR